MSFNFELFKTLPEKIVFELLLLWEKRTVDIEWEVQKNRAYLEEGNIYKLPWMEWSEEEIETHCTHIKNILFEILEIEFDTILSHFRQSERNLLENGRFK
jgi:hypothetical protein